MSSRHRHVLLACTRAESDFCSFLSSLLWPTQEEETGAACGDPRQSFILFPWRGPETNWLQGAELIPPRYPNISQIHLGPLKFTCIPQNSPQNSSEIPRIPQIHPKIHPGYPKFSPESTWDPSKTHLVLSKSPKISPHPQIHLGTPKSQEFNSKFTQDPQNLPNSLQNRRELYTLHFPIKGYRALCALYTN